MKKSWIKLVSLALVVIMSSVSLAACGATGGENAPEAAGDGGAAPAPSADAGAPSADGAPAGAAGQWKVGINYFTGGSYALLALKRTSEQAALAAGGETMALDNGVNVEQIVSDFENMIQSGCDGLIVWCPVPTVILSISQMCQEAQVPFVLSDKVPNDPGIIEALYANPYFAGAVAPANGEYGAYAARMALEAGYTKALLSTPGVGDATGTPRAEGFVAAFEAGGGTVYAVIDNDGTTDDGLANVEDALIAYPDTEIIFGTGSDFGKAAMQAVANNGGDCKVITCDFDEALLNQVGQGTLLGLVGDYWVAGFYAGVLLQNYLDGNPMLEDDGRPVWVEDLMYFGVDGAQLDLYKRFWIEEYCYSSEEINNMFVANNPDFTTADLKEAMYAYSLEERLNAKLAEGKVSAEELSAAGVNVG